MHSEFHTCGTILDLPEEEPEVCRRSKYVFLSSSPSLSALKLTLHYYYYYYLLLLFYVYAYYAYHAYAYYAYAYYYYAYYYCTGTGPFS